MAKRIASNWEIAVVFWLFASIIGQVVFSLLVSIVATISFGLLYFAGIILLLLRVGLGVWGAGYLIGKIYVIKNKKEVINKTTLIKAAYTIFILIYGIIIYVMVMKSGLSQGSDPFQNFLIIQSQPLLELVIYYFASKRFIRNTAQGTGLGPIKPIAE